MKLIGTPERKQSPFMRAPSLRGLTLLALFSALAFALISSVRLTAQGLYYDELFQATAAFNYIHRDDGGLSSVLKAEGIPILNMTYIGALKSAVYGLYLRIFGQHFTILSWRLLGILLVSTGILAMYFIVGKRLAVGWALTFLGLLVTDATVILAVRHDWGPVALALLLRLLFIAVWLRSTLDEACSPLSTMLLTMTVGFALFEKLSNVVLVIPLAIAFICDQRRRTRRHLSAFVIGGFIGIAPLLLVNLYTGVKQGALISFTKIGSSPITTQVETLRFFRNYFALGRGELLRSFILGQPRGPSWPEVVLMVALLALTGAIVYFYWRQTAILRFAGMTLLSYVVMGVAIWLMPRPNWVHHWVMGTPFQYAAIASTLVGIWGVSGSEPGRTEPGRRMRIGFVVLLICFMAYRIVGLAQLEAAFSQGRASESFDPSLTEFGEFAAANSDEAIFVAADWGLASQIVALSNGEPGIVREIFNDYDGPDTITRIANASGKDVLYVIARVPRSGVAPEETARIWEDIGALSGWQESPDGPESKRWRTVEIRRFIRRQ